MTEIACYRIVRIYRNDKPTRTQTPRTIKTGLTLEEAQAHCEREDTHGDGWFDGYDLMKGVKER